MQMFHKTLNHQQHQELVQIQMALVILEINGVMEMAVEVAAGLVAVEVTHQPQQQKLQSQLQ